MAYIIISVIVISLVGTLSHFLYDLTNHNKFVGIFAAVNESTWEHIKIALTPSFLWGLIDGYMFGENPNYFLAKAASIVTIIFLMPAMFYGHKFVARKDYFVFDIVSFYVVVTASQLVFDTIIKTDPIPFLAYYLSCASLFVLFGGYMVLTLQPIKNFIFKDPLTSKYGYKAHSEQFSIVKKKK